MKYGSIDELKALYRGFYVNDAVGNNAFSYALRKNKKIYVAELVKGDLGDVSLGDKVVFSEVEDGLEFNRKGLKNFIYYEKNGRHVFIFDNHNHAFFFWMFGYLTDLIKDAACLVHIDQHSDMRKPKYFFFERLHKNIALKSIFEYTNYVINVGNFIQPALKLGLFSGVDIIDSSWAFKKDIPENFVLDIDMDIFSNEMNYIDEDVKLEKIRRYMKQTNFITIATSPYFIEQEKAIKLIKKLFH